MTGLWVAGPNNAYVSAYANLVLHWDGSGSWKRDIMTSGTVFHLGLGLGADGRLRRRRWRPLPLDGRRQMDDAAVHATPIAGIGPLRGSGPTDIWLAGTYGEIFRSTGDGTWHEETTPQTPGVNQLWVASPNEAYFISYVTIMHRLAEHRRLGRRAGARSWATSADTFTGSGARARTTCTSAPTRATCSTRSATVSGRTTVSTGRRHPRHLGPQRQRRLSRDERRHLSRRPVTLALSPDRR